MRLAVIADIHGNAVALEAALADGARDPADPLVCLGDAIQGGPEPARVVERLRALGCPVVMGNADAWLLSGIETGAEVTSEERRQRLDTVRAWSLERLSAADRAFIQSFAPTVELALGDRRVLAFHGSPASFDEILLPDTPRAAFEQALLPHADHVLCGGHVHLQFLRRIGDSIHVNHGSVGLAYAHGQPEGRERFDPWAEYAMLRAEGGRLAVEFRRVPVDLDALERSYRGAGHPYAAESMARYGR